MIAVWLTLGAAAAVLLRYPPAAYNFYPRCPLYVYCHLLCPGCGSTRAVAALLRGELREALRWNPLAAALVPLLLVWGAQRSVAVFSGARPSLLTVRLPWTLAAGALALGYGVARNL